MLTNYTKINKNMILTDLLAVACKYGRFKLESIAAQTNIDIATIFALESCFDLIQSIVAFNFIWFALSMVSNKHLNKQNHSVISLCRLICGQFVRDSLEFKEKNQFLIISFTTHRISSCCSTQTKMWTKNSELMFNELALDFG